MLNNGNSTTAFTINIIAFAHGLFACIIAIIIFFIIVYHQMNNRMKRVTRITLLLCANIYLLIFIYSTTLVSFNIHTLLGDIFDQNFDSSWCTFRGYFVSVMLGAVYFAFVIQAFFRLCRIVYSSHRWLQLFWFYILLIILQIVLSFVLLCPLLIWHDIIYLPNEHYCFISFRNVRATVWTAFGNYGIPLFSLQYIYIRIIRFLRQQSNNPTLAIKRRQERDFLVIQRIIIIVSLLLTLGIPSIVLVSMLYATGVEHSLSYRMTWLSTNVSMAILSVMIVLMTPQLKTILIRRWRRTQVIRIDGSTSNSIELRTVPTHG